MRFVGIDPSTKTGVVVLDEHGNVLHAKEYSVPMVSGDDELQIHRVLHLSSVIRKGLDGVCDLKDSFICIEMPPYHAQGNAVSLLYGIAYALRLLLPRYTNINVTALKKFATGKGNTKKDDLAVHIFKRWGFEHPSDNVRDAYVLAQIARALYSTVDGLIAPQREVIEAIRKKGA